MEKKICKTCGVEQPKDDFTSRICKKNGRRYWDGECKICARKRARDWYSVNREEVLARDRAKYAADPSVGIAKMMKWYWANRDKARQSAADRRKNNIEQYKARDREFGRKWRQAHPLEAALPGKARRAKLKKAKVGQIKRSDIEALHKQQKGKCVVCQTKLAKYHIDHIMPLALGGAHEVKNLQLLCPPCNLSKKAMHPVDFMASRGFLL